VGGVGGCAGVRGVVGGGGVWGVSLGCVCVRVRGGLMLNAVCCSNGKMKNSER
jgi:hypothetical protein